MQIRATLELGGKTATGMRIPPEVVDALGAGKRPPVSVTINGHTYRSSIAVMGGVYMLGVSADVRERTGVKAGDGDRRRHPARYGAARSRRARGSRGAARRRRGRAIFLRASVA
jgi:hypothetical protein